MQQVESQISSNIQEKEPEIQETDLNMSEVTEILEEISEIKDTKDKGKMIQDENLEETRVSSHVYRDFLIYLGGWKFIVYS